MKCTSYNCECKYAEISPRDVPYCRGINYLENSGAEDRAIECGIKIEYNIPFEKLFRSYNIK